MIIIGIDADVRRVAYGVIHAGRRFESMAATIQRTNNRGSFDPEYDQQLTALLRRACEWGAVVWIEHIYLPENLTKKTVPRNVQTFQRLAEVQGEIARAARLYCVPIQRVGPTVWHSAVLGFTCDREELKDAAMAKAREIVDRELTEHEADALCVALYGLRAAESEQESWFDEAVGEESATHGTR